MIPICDSHAALLRKVAENLSAVESRRVYADWLQENGNCGWLIVARYPPEQWPVWVGNRKRAKNGWQAYTQKGEYKVEAWELPWLSGTFTHSKRIPQPRSRVKQILLAYAEGSVV